MGSLFLVRKSTCIKWWVWPFILNYSHTHFHASYMEYSRMQTLKAHKSYKIVLSYAHVIVFYCTLENKNLL